MDTRVTFPDELSTEEEGGSDEADADHDCDGCATRRGIRYQRNHSMPYPVLQLRRDSHPEPSYIHESDVFASELTETVPYSISYV